MADGLLTNTETTLEDKFFAFNMSDIIIIFKIVCLYYIIISFNLVIMYVNNLQYPDISLVVFPKAMNTVILGIGISEGTRGFTKSATTDIGNYYRVPSYKISYLIKLLIDFVLIGILLIIFDSYCKNLKLEKVSPNFYESQMLEVSLSCFISYVFCRYGSKTAENIDVSGIASIFKKK